MRINKPALDSIKSRQADELKSLISEAISTVYEQVYKPTQACFGLLAPELAAENLLCYKAENRSECILLVFSGHSLQEKLEKFLHGLGSLFREMRGDVPLRSLPDMALSSYLMASLNQIGCDITSGLRIIFSPQGNSPCILTKELGEKLLRDFFGKQWRHTGIAFSSVFHIAPFRRYNSGSISAPLKSNQPEWPKASIDAELSDRLVAAENRADETFSALVESQRRELYSLELISELRREVARLTRCICELKAENQGLRAQLLDRQPALEGSPENAIKIEQYPVGQGIDPIKWLEDHYGHRLTYFGASENTLFQDQLRHSDPGLFRAIENRINYEKRKNKGCGIALREIIPTKADRNTHKLTVALVGFDSLPSLLNTAKYRASRAKPK